MGDPPIFKLAKALRTIEGKEREVMREQNVLLLILFVVLLAYLGVSFVPFLFKG